MKSVATASKTCRELVMPHKITRKNWVGTANISTAQNSVGHCVPNSICVSTLLCEVSIISIGKSFIG